MKIIRNFAIAVCSILTIASCGSGSQQQTLENSKNLLALQQEVINGDTLYGVRTIFDTIQVVPMAKWDSIKALSSEMVTAYRSGEMYAYMATGKQMGKGALTELLTITTSSADSTTFYRGVEAEKNTSVFYFPKTNSIVDNVSDMYIGRTVMLLATADGWDVRNYDGKLIWQADEKDCCILRRIYGDEETIQIVRLTQKMAEIYSVNGEFVTEVPLSAWTKAIKNFRRTDKIGEATYGELDIHYQF